MRCPCCCCCRAGRRTVGENLQADIVVDIVRHCLWWTMWTTMIMGETMAKITVQEASGCQLHKFDLTCPTCQRYRMTVTRGFACVPKLRWALAQWRFIFISSSTSGEGGVKQSMLSTCLLSEGGGRRRVARSSMFPLLLIRT